MSRALVFDLFNQPNSKGFDFSQDLPSSYFFFVEYYIRRSLLSYPNSDRYFLWEIPISVPNPLIYEDLFMNLGFKLLKNTSGLSFLNTVYSLCADINTSCLVVSSRDVFKLLLPESKDISIIDTKDWSVYDYYKAKDRLEPLLRLEKVEYQVDTRPFDMSAFKNTIAPLGLRAEQYEKAFFQKNKC